MNDEWLGVLCSCGQFKKNCVLYFVFDNPNSMFSLMRSDQIELVGQICDKKQKNQTINYFSFQTSEECPVY
jgi:hypothetical protein